MKDEGTIQIAAYAVEMKSPTNALKSIIREILIRSWEILAEMYASKHRQEIISVHNPVASIAHGIALMTQITIWR
jgi:hypothetical protein